MLVYVDDIIVTGSSASLVYKIIQQHNTVFSLKQLGTLDYFLGIEVKSLQGGSLLLSQSKYIRGPTYQDIYGRTHFHGVLYKAHKTCWCCFCRSNPL